MLLIDSGNSRLKWAYVQNGAWQAQGAAQSRDWPALWQAFSALPRPRRILVSNVAGSPAAQQLSEICAALWNRPIAWMTAQREQCGLRNSYIQPAQLGSDRWAALIAAWQQQRSACLVVMAGTATTIDALSDDGVFTGGIILPGLALMQASLSANTALPPVANGQLRAFPRNTADALYSGAMQATLGAITRQYELLHAANAPCILGGGAADILQPQLTMRLLRADDLVLQGLQLIGMETEA
jgi:type III pantothenate kinase